MTVVGGQAEDGAGFVAVPWVTARAVLPLPAADNGEPTELHLLDVAGPPGVVAAAVEGLGLWLEEHGEAILDANRRANDVYTSASQEGE